MIKHFSMIHEIYPHIFNNQFISDIKMGEEDYVFHYKADSLLLRTNGNGFILPQKKDFTEISDSDNAIYLFSLNHVSCFLVQGEQKPADSGFEYREINFFRTMKQKEITWVSLAGLQMATWYNQNKFCGSCGTPTQPATHERAVICKVCNITVYPKISPAIIVAIICRDKILLARNANFRGNWYSLIAGYADIGESLEETVKREVQEEVGLEIRNLRYYKSQPWPLSGSMMTGFIAEADDSQPVNIDQKEISEAAWFTRDNLPDFPSTLSIAGEMIEKFRLGEL